MISDLEGTIRDLLQRHEHAREGGAEQRFLRRQLVSLRLTYEEAGGIIEEFSPGDWFCGPEDYRLVGIDVTSAHRARKPISRFVGFRREPGSPSTGMPAPAPVAVAGYVTTFSTPRSMAAALDLEIDEVRAARERIIDLVFELYEMMRPEDQDALPLEVEEKVGEINRRLCKALGIDESDPL